MFFHKEEGLSRQEIDALQTRRLQNLIERARQAPFYKKQLQGIGHKSLKTPKDICRLPFTTKEDLRAGYPYDLLTCPLDDCVRLHASSGTTGNPTVIFYTENDIKTWAGLMARCMYMVGIRKTDIFQNMSGYGLFTGGLGIHYGAEHLGCLTIPAGAGNTKRQIKLIYDFGVTVLHIIPSYALYFAAALEKQGIDPKTLSPRIALIGAEPHTHEARLKIEEMLALKAYNSYGLSEMNGPGVAFECEEQNGMHLWEDAYILEIIDPDTLEPVETGEVGELVITSLTRQGMPIIRYRTKDLTRILPGICPCGRNHHRIDRITGRADDMIIIKGVNIYPMQVEQVLLGIPEVAENYQIILEREEFIDQLRVKVEIKNEAFVEDMRILQGLQTKVQRLLCNELLITPRVDIVQSGSLPQAEGKAKRVLDLRKE